MLLTEALLKIKKYRELRNQAAARGLELQEAGYTVQFSTWGIRECRPFVRFTVSDVLNLEESKDV